jgi:multiple sugar transport system ATP-binding protein
MLAGLEEVTSGSIRIGDRDVTNLPPKERDIAMVFQNYALYPHMSVAENMAFSLKMAKVPTAERKERVDKAAEILGLTEYLQRKPKALSGGQRQRVAMGRAIVRAPQVFCMDEPLSNLDAKMRVQTRTDIAKLQADLGVTTVYVTHDQVEAMTMGDRVAVMRDGLLVQVDTPQTLYDRPVDLFVAGFMGSPAMNFVRARLEASNGSLLASFGSNTLELPARALPHAVTRNGLRDVILGLRPEHLDLVGNGSNGKAVLRAPVTLAEPVGAQVIVHLDVETLSVVDQGDFCACLDSRSGCSQGETLALAIDPATLHFFDPETETSLQ